jgi:hypothetical protein
MAMINNNNSYGGSAVVISLFKFQRLWTYPYFFPNFDFDFMNSIDEWNWIFPNCINLLMPSNFLSSSYAMLSLFSSPLKLLGFIEPPLECYRIVRIFFFRLKVLIYTHNWQVLQRRLVKELWVCCWTKIRITLLPPNIGFLS